MRRDTSREHKVVKLADVLRQARGSTYLGLEAGIWVFVLSHVSGLFFLILCDTYLGDRVKGLWRWEGATSTDFLYVSCVVLAFAGHIYLYWSLFGSDPGWLPRADFSEGPPGEGICPWCRARPVLRSRHDHHTGQCVAKFDHFCPILGTTIGDCNHAGFWLYNATQAFMAAWGLVLAFQSSGPCLWSSSPEIQEACWQGVFSLTTARTFALLITSMLLAGAVNVFAGLWFLHTVLAATGQTTYEAFKGHHVPYLAPFYEHYRGPMHPMMHGNQMQLLLQRYLEGSPLLHPSAVGL